jgi:hypothetical protein
MDRQDLIFKIEQYGRAANLKPSTICQYALLNRRFYANLCAGRDYQIGTAQRLVEWMENNPPADRGAA